MIPPKIDIHTDGGSRGNPGPAAIGVVIREASTKKLIHCFSQTIGVATNNIAEYQAVIAAYNWLINHQASLVSLNFFLDSALVVNQMKGLWRVKDSNLRQKVIQLRELEASLNCSIQYTAIPRELNSEADLLLNQALDKKL